MKDIELLHPIIKSKCKQLITLALRQGIDIIITQTLRAKAEQDALYVQGRTKPGSIVTKCKYPDSPHCWGVAFDFCVIKDGKADWSDTAAYDQVGQLAKSIGLYWGGDFKSFVDRPHVEDPKYVINQSIKWLKSVYGTPDTFIKYYQNLIVEKEGEEVEQTTITLEKRDGSIQDLIGQIYQGTTLAPVRALAEALGCRVDYDPATKRVKIVEEEV